MHRTQPSQRLFGLLAFAAIGFGTLAWPALSGRAILVYRDMLHDYWPMKALFWQSPGPLVRTWNHSWFAGLTLVGDIVQQPLYLPNLLFRLLRAPAWPGIAWYLALHWVLTLVGAFLLCRRLAGAAAAAVGATVFSLCGVTLSNLNNLQWACAASWSPLVLWAADRVAREPSLASAAAFALLVPQPLIAGDPQAFLVLCGCSVAIIWVRARRRGPAFGHLAMSLAAGALLAAPQALATFSSLSLQAREELLTDRYRELWSFHPARIPEFWVPKMFGSMFTTSYWGEFTSRPDFPRPHLQSAYLGALWPALLLAGLRFRRRAALPALLGLSTLLWLSLGSHGFHLYLMVGRVVPTWNLYRYPERLLVVPALAGAVIAALGTDALAAASRRTRVALAAVAAAAGVASLAAAGWLAPGEPFAHPTSRQAILHSAVQIVIVCAAGMLLAFLRPRLAVPALCALLTVDLAASGGEVLGVVSRGPFEERPRACALLAEAAKNAPIDSYRIHVDQPRSLQFPMPQAVREELPAWAWTGWRSYQLGKRNLLDLCGHLSSSAYTSLNPKSMLALRRAVDPNPLRALEATATRFVVLAPDAAFPASPHLVVRARDAETRIEVRELTAAIPRVFRPAAIAVDPDPLARIRGDPRALTVELALLESGSSPHQPSPEARLAAFVDGGDTIELTIEQAAPGYWVIADELDGTWRATVDEVAAEMVRADLFRRAVWAPAGRHRVRLEARRINVLLPFWGSLALGAALLVAALTSRRRPDVYADGSVAR